MIFIGVDQTGAFNRKAMKASPLPVAIIAQSVDSSDRSWKMFCFDELRQKPLSLGSFDHQSIRLACRQLKLDESASKLVAVDCVLGLPQPVYDGLSQSGWFQKGSAEQHLRGCFDRVFDYCNELRLKKDAFLGRKAAEIFFESMMLQAGFTEQAQRNDENLLRVCEKNLGAQSLFKARPYQRNIQTGSFRIWYDLGKMQSEGEIFSILPFHNMYEKYSSSSSVMLITEAYPSIYWHSDWGLKKREPEHFVKRLSKSDLPIDFSQLSLHSSKLSLDHFDAIVSVLALFYRYGPNSKKNQINTHSCGIEGYILV